MSHPKEDHIGRMSTQEIFRNSKELNRSGEDWRIAYAKAFQVLQTPKFRMMRSGNTLFIYEITKPSVAKMFIVNADSPKKFLRNLKEFAKAMHHCGFKTVFGYTDDMPTVTAIQHLGHDKVKVEKSGLTSSKNQTYRVEVNV
jgi:hypothetical protein